MPESLRALVEAVAAAPRLDDQQLDRLARLHPKEGSGFYSKREMLEAYRREPWRYEASELDLAARLRTAPTRSLSGVLPVTVLTKPFPCPGRCSFCPSDVRMPKSYVASEPGCQRAEQNRFDPYRQTWSRLAAYRRMGHPTAKVELIVLGGTWSHYPEAYQRFFVQRCLEALSDFGDGVDRSAELAVAVPDFERGPSPLRGHDARGGDYDRAVAGHLRAAQAGRLLTPEEDASWETLDAAQQRNEQARCRCVGLALETRPDRVDEAEVWRLRRLGATKVQLGVQSLDDDVLDRCRRGHDVAASHAAIRRLRGAGFKIHAHWMANLPGSDPRADRRDFGRLFSDPRVRPDELKIYPTSLIETAELVRDHEAGLWAPYDRETLVALLADCLEQVPAWCRVTRVIRDIPSPEILVGSRETNLREVVEQKLAREGRPLREIRVREVRGEPVDPARVAFCERIYETSTGVERFIEARLPSGRIAGFLRLALPRTAPPAGGAELERAALIREVHVYGQARDLGDRGADAAQHGGLGTALVRRAAARAGAAGFAGLAVISAVGTRRWYAQLGFESPRGSLYPRLPLR